VTEQQITDRLYEHIREANAELYRINSGWRFVETLDVRQVNPKTEIEPPSPTIDTSTGQLCPECGHADLMRTGSCLTCARCGASVGGCG
jgi:hypothetical protein